MKRVKFRKLLIKKEEMESYYTPVITKKLSTHFSEIRDQNGNLELNKSLIFVPIVFVTSLAKICAKLLISLL
ncbi:MAG: hypothetical protein ACR5KV_00150 [Wolbachia sp.]